MPLDHSKATVTMSFTGLSLFRLIEKSRAKECEVGILECPRHKLSLFIEEVTMDADGRTPLKSSLLSHKLDLTRDIFISVHKPSRRGVRPYFGPGKGKQFNRVKDIGDEEDFRWTIDLETKEFHGGKVGIKPSAAKHFNPKIFISDGTLFTERKTEELFVRESIKDPEEDPEKGRDPERFFLGRIALKTGLDIKCAAGSRGVNIRNDERNSLDLPVKEKTKYYITVENVCPLPDEIVDGSDFRFYYDALTTPDGKRYDLRRVVPKSPGGGQENIEFDKWPRVCTDVGGGIIEDPPEEDPPPDGGLRA